MTRLLFITICLFGFALDTYAKNCSKGKPCGNSCIAMNKTCRSSSGSSSYTYTPPPRSTYQAPTAAAAGAAALSTAPAQSEPATEPRPGVELWELLPPPAERTPSQYQTPQPAPTRPRSHEAELRLMYVVKPRTYAVVYPSRSAPDSRPLAMGTRVPVYEVLTDWARITTGASANEWVALDALAAQKK